MTARSGGVCCFLVTIGTALLLMLTSTGASRSKALRTLKLEDAKCGCGKNMAEELVVKRTKLTYCTEVPYRGPRGVPKADESGYPLRVKVRRSLDKSRILIKWNLKYIPKKKRAKVSDFYLYFSKTQKKRRTIAQRGACFVVKTKSSKQCRKKVTCEVSYPKRRPRGVSLNLYYRFAARKSESGGRSKRRGPRKFIRLKASVGRKRRSPKMSADAPTITTTTGNNIRDCNEWVPSIDARCVGNGTLSVRFDPENPLADEIEVGLHEGISPKQKNVTVVPKGSHSCTFENLESGNYSVTLRPLSKNCYGVVPWRSPVVPVNVDDSPRWPVGHGPTGGITSCNDWHPRINVRCTGNKTLLVEFDPDNPLAEKIEIGVHKGISPMRKDYRLLPKGTKNCTFGNLDRGNYSVTLRPRSPACYGVLPFRSAVVEVKEDISPCDWYPRIDVSCDEDKALHVKFDPANPLAEEIEVDLLEDISHRINEVKILPKGNTNCTFEKIASGNYSVTLRPRSSTCPNMLPVRSSLVEVKQDHIKSDHIKSCDEWYPRIDVSCDKSKAVHVRFDPVNPLAEEIEVDLHEGFSEQINATKILPMKNTSCTFENLAPANYSVTLRPRSSACSRVGPVRSALVEVKNKPDTPCENWHPKIDVRCDGKKTLRVSFDPENPLAEDIEVDLHEGVSELINATKWLPRGNTSCTFENLASANYSVTLRPRSKACAKALPVRSTVIMVGGKTTAISVSGESSPNANTTKRAGSTTTTTPTTTTITTTMSTPTIVVRDPHFQAHVLAMLISCVLIVAVAVLVVVWICKRKKAATMEESMSLDASHDTTPPPMETPVEMEETSFGSPENHHPDDLTPSCDVPEDTIVKQPLLGAPHRHATLETVDETQPLAQNPPANFAEQYEHENQTTEKSVISSEPRIVFLVHAGEAEVDTGLKDILGHFTRVMQSLSSGSIAVKLDFMCRQENQKDVNAWAERVLQSCTNVVVVLSERFLQVCQSYEKSMALAVHSPSAYTDVAPLVMRRLSEGQCPDRAVFVHFGLPDAEGEFQSVLDLYTSPRRLAKSGGCEVLDSGKAASSPPVFIGGTAMAVPPSGVPPDSEEAPPYRSVESVPGGNNPCCERPLSVPQSRLPGSAGPGCTCRASPRVRLLSTPYDTYGNPGQNAVGRERHKSAPQGTNGLCFIHYPTYCLAHCMYPRLPLSSSASSSSYHTACHHLSPAGSEYHDALPPPYDDCIRESSPPCTQPLSRSPPDSEAKTHPWSNGRRPRLISLSRPQGLTEFLRVLSGDEKAIESAVTSSGARSLFLSVEQRQENLNPRGEPVEHSCATSPAQSVTSLC